MSLNYAALILETEKVESKNEEIATKQVAKKKPDVVYTIDGISGPDMVITKKSTRKEEQFVMLMSQGQMYIKDLKIGTVTMAEPEHINVFFDKLEEPLECIDAEGHKLNWTDKFYRGMKFARVLYRLHKNDERLREYFNKGLFYINLENWQESDISVMSNQYRFKPMQMIYNLVPENFKKDCLNYITSRLLGAYNTYRNQNDQTLDDYDHNKLTSLIEAFKGDLEENIYIQTYGIVGARKIITEYFQTAVSKFPSINEIKCLFGGSGNYRHNGINRTIDFDINLFIQYLFYSSVEQGYANEINNFIDLWRDTLNMQYFIYGNKIINKYPENLATMHQIYNYKYDLVRQEIDKLAWEEQVDRMKKFERHGEKYIIIAPTTPEDMTEEARQQSNCLSSYIRHVTNGTCMIFFMRHTSEPEKSLVTIEVTKEGQLGQVKARFNQTPSDEQMEYVNKWYRDKFIKKAVEESEVE